MTATKTTAHLISQDFFSEPLNIKEYSCEYSNSQRNEYLYKQLYKFSEMKVLWYHQAIPIRQWSINI